MQRRLFLVSSLALAACSKQPLPALKSTDITGATFGRDFALDDHHGRRRKLADFRGKAVVLFFGYTSCPDICPTTLARLAATMKALGADAARVQVLFASVDPERDTAEKLAAFVPWFHPDFLGLRGTPEETQQAITEFRVFAAKQTVEGSLGYVIDHSTGAYVFDPAGRLRLYVKDDVSAEDLAGDLRILLAGR